MDDHVIDINEYLARGDQDQGRGTFSLWGSEGDRVRFAMPVWRAISLLNGARGGVVCYSGGAGDPRLAPFFILDLEKDPARTHCSEKVVEPLLEKEPSAMVVTEEGVVAVLLGGEEMRRWFLVVFDVDKERPLVGRTREQLLFLAGECAGLLFFGEPPERTA